MASALPVSTPSPPGSVHTPNTPKHGYCDSWEPYSPRKSARISSRRQSSNRTPSPRSSTHQFQSTRSSKKITSSTSASNASSFSTPATSPTKKRMPAMDSVRRASGAVHAESSASAADALRNNRKTQDKYPGPAAASRTQVSMLPTPDKTPRKPPSAATEAASHSIARTLFASENDVLASSSKKKNKVYSGISLDSFTAEPVEENIEIFTDSRDRVPEVDNSAENPFYGNGATTSATAQPVRRSRRNKVTVPGEGRKAIDDVLGREDGCVVIFRGKKLFRKFDEAMSPLGEEGGQDPTLRSRVQPRRLFAPEDGKGKQHATSSFSTPDLEDEEAPTEIEDNGEDSGEDTMQGIVHSDTVQTPVRDNETKAKAPGAPRYAPASPPSVRATRSSNKSQSKVPSPFHSWRVSKNRSESNNSKSPHGQKRDGQHLGETTTAGSKRQRA